MRQCNMFLFTCSCSSVTYLGNDCSSLAPSWLPSYWVAWQFYKTSFTGNAVTLSYQLASLPVGYINHPDADAMSPVSNKGISPSIPVGQRWQRWDSVGTGWYDKFWGLKALAVGGLHRPYSRSDCTRQRVEPSSMLIKLFPQHQKHGIWTLRDLNITTRAVWYVCVMILCGNGCVWYCACDTVCDCVIKRVTVCDISCSVAAADRNRKRQIPGKSRPVDTSLFLLDNSFAGRDSERRLLSTLPVFTNTLKSKTVAAAEI